MQEPKKIVQITSTNGMIYALTSDGMIYKYSNKGDWKALPQIQEDENEKTRND